LNEEQIERIDGQRLKEKKVDSLIEAAGTPGMGGEGESGAAGGVDDLFGNDGGDTSAEPPASEPKPPPENAGETPEEEEPGSRVLLTGGDDPGDNEDFALRLRDLQDKPINVSSQLDKALYNRGRRRTHGASRTHMPDFVKMTGARGRSMEDPYDVDWIRSAVSNPFSESTRASQRPMQLSLDVSSTLRRMTVALGIDRSSNVLSEARDVQDEIDESSGDIDLELVDVAPATAVFSDEDEG
jgi:hypothetical protein